MARIKMKKNGSLTIIFKKLAAKILNLNQKAISNNHINMRPITKIHINNNPTKYIMKMKMNIKILMTMKNKRVQSARLHLRIVCME